MFSLLIQVPSSKKSRTARKHRLKVESLEDRRLLSSNQLGGVSGRVFIDSDGSNDYTPGEEIANATVQVYEDTNNNNNFDGGDQLAGTDTTDSEGIYQIDGLTTGNYFAVQTAQNVAGVSLAQQVSPRKVVSGVGVTSTGFDTFQTFTTNVTASEPAPSSDSENFLAAEAIGGQRDFTAELTEITAALVWRTFRFQLGVACWQRTPPTMQSVDISSNGMVSMTLPTGLTSRV